MSLEPVKPLPAALRAKTDDAVIRAQQDTSADALGTIGRGEDLIPLGKVSGAGELWYMVKTKSGAVGWISGGDVEEIGVRK